MRASRLTLFTVCLLVTLIEAGRAQPASESSILQRVDVHMEYDWKMPKGRAAVQWTTLRETSGLSVAHARIALAGFLYARTIVNHEETRRNLIERTESAAVDLVKGADRFAMDKWRLEAGGLSFPIYPWQRVPSDQLRDVRTYTAFLIETSDGHVAGYLKMAWGLERILAPAAPLIVFEALARELTEAGRVLLGRVIRSINDFYGMMDLKDTARLLGSDSLVTTLIVGFLRDEQSFAHQETDESTISREEFQTLSEELAKKMGRMFALQQACRLQSNVSPERTAGFFINYMSESEVQKLMDSYAIGMEESASQACDRETVGQGLITMMGEMRAYINTARPFMKKW